MSWKEEKTEQGTDIVISGFENGIAPSPHLGIADIKNLNLNSFPGEAAVNYNRAESVPSQVVGGTFNTLSSSELEYLAYTTNPLYVGCCVHITASSISGLSTGFYWIIYMQTSVIHIAATYGGVQVTGMGNTGTATFTTVYPENAFVQGASEYVLSRNQYRYYIADVSGMIWVYDPNIYSNWSPISGISGVTITNSDVSGMVVTNGVLMIFWESSFAFIETDGIGNSSNWTSTGAGVLQTPAGNKTNPHYAISSQGENSAIFYCDGSFVGEISSSQPNVDAGTVPPLCTLACSSSGTTVTITSQINGSTPVNGLAVHPFVNVGGTIPSPISDNLLYYIIDAAPSAGTFSLSETAGGSAISIGTGAFYLNSFFPNPASGNSGGDSTTFLMQAIRLSSQDISTCLTQLSSGGSLNIVVGTKSNNLYLWQLDASVPYAVLPLPEPDTHRLLNVDNMIYCFTGNKGNIYLTNGTTIAGALSVPDYVANPYGTNQDPWFQWGDVMFLRGRVWFSIQDQHVGNTTGNCGGVWSFTPTQNLFLGQDQGIQLRLENQSSYATYNGVVQVVIPQMIQQSNGPQYYSAWASDYSSPTYGIDQSGTVPYNGSQYGQIDTDLIPVGTSLNRFTGSNIEFKLSRPLVSGESIVLYARGDLTSAFEEITSQQGSGSDSTAGDLSFSFDSNFSNNQWLQLRARLYSTISGFSAVPITEMRIRMIA